MGKCSKHYAKKKSMLKGIAFPTSISCNNVLGHFCPGNKDDKTALKEGDVVKIDFGVHFDGCINQMANTVIATDKPTEQVTGKVADVICAAYFAGEGALHLLKAGSTNTQVTDLLQKVAADFDVNVVEGVFSNELTRFNLDSENVIISKDQPDQKVDEVKFEHAQAWVIDIVMSTGDGKPKLSENKATIFKKNVGEKYNLKQASSRDVLNHVTKNYNNLAWNVRSVKEAVGAKAMLGIKEMKEHELITDYPVLQERNKAIVAQFKFTVLILPTKTQKLNQAPLPYVSSEKKVVNEDVNKIMQIPLVNKKTKAPKLVAEEKK